MRGSHEGHNALSDGVRVPSIARHHTRKGGGMSASDPDTTDPATRDEDEVEAHAAHEPDRAPTPDEESLAERNTIDASVGEHFREMAKTGADVKGEGEVE
jgi:hypothetical protein